MLTALGVVPQAAPAILRLDLAAELIFANPALGLSFLRACERGLMLPRLAMRTYLARGESRLETIAWQTPSGNQTQFRAYCADSKHGTHPAGSRLRFERQRRWTGRNAPTVEQLISRDLGAIFREPIRRWISGEHQALVSAPDDAIMFLLDKVRTSALTRRKGEALCGNIAVLAHGPDLLSPDDRRKRERDLRLHGISLNASGDPKSAAIDLSRPMKALAQCWGQSE